MGKRIFYFDGSYLPASMDVLRLFTPGLQRWHGVFETMRVVGENVEFIDGHLTRMMKGLKTLKIAHHLSILGLKSIVAQVVRKNSIDGPARLRIMVFALAGRVHCLVMVLPYPASRKRTLRVCAVQVPVPLTTKQAWVKSLDYGLYADAYAKARSKGYDEAMIIDPKGHVVEASRANLFICRKGVLLTPPLSSGCLDGIIRRQVIVAARRLKVQVVEKDLTPADIRRADHAFLTNSLAGLVRFDYN